MFISLRKNTPENEIQRVIDLARSRNVEVNLFKGADYVVLGLLGDTSHIEPEEIKVSPWVMAVQRVSAPYKLANRLLHPNDSIIDVGGIRIGAGERIAIIAGPATLESNEHAKAMALSIKGAGASIYKGGCYKARTSPYSFQGLGENGLDYLSTAGKNLQMPVASELQDSEQIELFNQKVDLIIINSGNMFNFSLLKKLGQKTNKPILLKRSQSATIDEWLMSAEYLMANGNPNVILCERGVKSFDRYHKASIDMGVVAALKQRTHLPVVIDPSHSTGDWRLVESVFLAGIAAGADGMIIDVHNDPQHALSDASLSLYSDQLQTLIEKCDKMARVLGRSL